MTATLTIHLDPEVLRLAEREASAHHTTVADVVSRQLRIMARNWEESRAGRTPVTDALRGVVELPSDFDAKERLTAELLKEHGVQS